MNFCVWMGGDGDEFLQPFDDLGYDKNDTFRCLSSSRRTVVELQSRDAVAYICLKYGVRVSHVKPSNCFRLHHPSMISKHSTIPVPVSL